MNRYAPIPIGTLTLLAVGSTLAGCRPGDTFRCEHDQQCRRGNSFGFCEPVGYCSFTDGDCPSSHRYDDTAGDDIAGECVPLTDAGVDSTVMPDGEQWPCGVKPAAPPATVTRDDVLDGNHMTLTFSNTMVNGARVIEVAPGEALAITIEFSLVDCICPMCIDQVEVGLVPGPRMACVYDANPNLNNACEPPTSDLTMLTRAAPTTPGLYELRFGLAQDFDCMAHPSWWLNTPPSANATVAYVCVR